MKKEQRKEHANSVHRVRRKPEITYSVVLGCFGRQARHDTAPCCFRSRLAHQLEVIRFLEKEHHMSTSRTDFGVRNWSCMMRRKKVDEKRRVYICRAQGASLTCS